jgi:hypothetical protein
MQPVPAIQAPVQQDLPVQPVDGPGQQMIEISGALPAAAHSPSYFLKEHPHTTLMKSLNEHFIKAEELKEEIKDL